MHLPPIDWGQVRLARTYPVGLVKKAVAKSQTPDPETAAGCRTALGTHQQPGHAQGSFSTWSYRAPQDDAF